MLAINEKARFNDDIWDKEYRTHAPYSSSTFNANDEVRIAIQQQDTYTYPHESYLHVIGSVTKADGATEDATLKLVNNAVAFLFEHIRYEINGIEIDRTKSPGIASTLYGLVKFNPLDENRLENAAWFGYGKDTAVQQFSFCVPLRNLMGFFQDFRRIILNQKQELIILLTSSMKNALHKSDAIATFSDFKLSIEKIYWRIQHLKVSTERHLDLMRTLEENTPLDLPFRSWELYEYPALPTTNRHSWTIKTSSQVEKPRYVILAFQTDRKNNLTKDMSIFDSCSITDFKLYLNSNYYPYDNLKGDKSLMYEMYARVQWTVNGCASYPVLTRSEFDKHPIYVVDCSNQDESLRLGPVDVRLEFEAKNNFPANTTAYCLIIHDALVQYSPLTGNVSRVM